MAAAETVGNQELIKRFWGFPCLGQGFLGAWLRLGRVRETPPACLMPLPLPLQESGKQQTPAPKSLWVQDCTPRQSLISRDREPLRGQLKSASPGASSGVGWVELDSCLSKRV